MNCSKSAQVHPVTTILGHTLVMLHNKGHYEGAQVHPVTTILGHTLVTLHNKGHYEGAQVYPAFLTRAQMGPLCID